MSRLSHETATYWVSCACAALIACCLATSKWWHLLFCAHCQEQTYHLGGTAMQVCPPMRPDPTLADVCFFAACAMQEPLQAPAPHLPQCSLPYMPLRVFTLH